MVDQLCIAAVSVQAVPTVNKQTSTYLARLLLCKLQVIFIIIFTRNNFIAAYFDFVLLAGLSSPCGYHLGTRSCFRTVTL